MSTVYIPSPAAPALSDALWALSRPPEVRGPNDTQYLFPWRPALDGSQWLEVETTYAIPVHPDAVLNGIADVLQPYIERGDLPVGTNEDLTALIESKRGQKLVVYEAFPPFFKAQALSHEQMVEQGKFAAPPTP